MSRLMQSLWAWLLLLLWMVPHVAVAQNRPPIRFIGPQFDSTYFRRQEMELEAIPTCKGALFLAAPSAEVLDRYDSLASAEPGILLKYVGQKDKKLNQDFAQHLSPIDLKWLRIDRKAFATKTREAWPWNFNPQCKRPIASDLQFAKLDALLAMLVEQPATYALLRGFAADHIIHMVRRSLSLDEVHAQETYVGGLTDIQTPSGPGLKLEAWHLQRFDPNHQWRLFQVSMWLHYDKNKQLHRATVYLLPIAGQYKHHQEYLSSYVWEEKLMRSISLSVEPDENAGTGFLRHTRIWKP